MVIAPARCLRLAALSAGLMMPVFGDFASALRAYQEKDYATAAKEWRELADGGDPASQFNLGLLYLDGIGVPQSITEAIEWFRRAADPGYPKAQYNLGGMYAAGKVVRRDYITAHMWLNLCAATADPKCIAQRDLVQAKMRDRDILEAQRRAAAWKPTPGVPKDDPKESK